MSNIYDDIQNSLGAQLERTAAIKADYLKEKTLEKKQLLNPGYGEFNPDEWDIIDGDTVVNKADPSKTLRFAGPNGHSMDTFETWKKDPQTGERYNPYDKNPGRAYYHRAALAKQLGKDIGDVSNQDLVEAGEAQAEHLRQNFEAFRGATFTEDGQGKYGRSIARFDNPEVFDVVTKGVNAGYYAPSNALGYLEDFAKGDTPAPKQNRSFARALTGDALTSVAVGTGRMVSGLSQGVLNLLGANNSDGVNKFFNGLNKGLDNMNEYLSSDGKLQREGYDKKEQELLSTLWDVRKREYKEANPGAEEWQANLSAITDEAADRIEYLLENPGRILDASLESLPYMIGVGAVGRAVALKQTARLRGSFLKNMKTGTRSERALARPKNAKGQFLSDTDAVNKYMQSAEFAKSIKTATHLSGVGTVGLTEGFSNAADVFNSVNNMTEEEAMQSEKYQKLRKQGMSHTDAVGKLAKEAFNSTLVTTTLVAGVASAVTGAAGFESRLFTRLADRVPGKISANNKLLKFAQETGRVTGSFTGPGAREAVEETIQSGGGELLGQIAKKDATGLGEVGPGVGTAAGEGGLVGLVSGAVAGGSGTAAKAAIKGGYVAGKQVGKVFSNKNTKLDEVTIQTPLTDEQGKVGGSTLEARAALGKGDKNPEQLLNESLDALQGDAKGAVLVNHIRTFIDAVAQDTSIPVERKEVLLKKAKSAFNRAGAEATIQARSILQENTMEEIEANPKKREMLQIISMAQNYGQLKKEDLHDGMGKYFSASSAVAEAVAKAEAIAAQTTQAEGNKPATQVFQEKMGEGLGLRGHIGRIDNAIENNDEREYHSSDQDLLRFIKTQVQRVTSLEEMADRIGKGEPAEKVEAETNKKYGTELKWVPPNAKVERTNKKYNANILSGSLELASKMRQEVDQMIAAREGLSKKAIDWSDGNKEIVKTAKAVVKENKTLNKPYIPGVSAEGGGTTKQPEVKNGETTSASSTATDSEPAVVEEGNAGQLTKAEIEKIERDAQDAEQRLHDQVVPDERNPPPIDEVPYIPGVTDTDSDNLDAAGGRGEGVEADGTGSQASEASVATEVTEAEDAESEEKPAVFKKDPDSTYSEREQRFIFDILQKIGNPEWAKVVTFHFIPEGKRPLFRGRFHEKTGRISITVTRAELESDGGRVIWALFHEFTHKRIHDLFMTSGKLENYFPSTNPKIVGKVTKEYKDFITAMSKNATVKAIAAAKLQVLPNRQNFKLDSFIATEEALAEIGAALKSGNWTHLEAEYGVEISEEMKGTFQKEIPTFLDMLIQLFQDFLGLTKAPTDDAVLALMQGVTETAPLTIEQKIAAINELMETPQAAIKHYEAILAKAEPGQKLSANAQSLYDQALAEVADLGVMKEQFITAKDTKATQADKDAALPFIPGITEGSQKPVESTEQETPGEPKEKVQLEGFALEEARRNVYELQRLETDGDKFKSPNMIRLTDQRLTWAIRTKMDKGMGASQAANEMLAAYEQKYTSDVFTAPESNVSSEEEAALLASTDAITKEGTTESTIMASFEPAIDLLSDTATKLLGLYVNKRKSPLSNWTEEELAETRNAIKEKLRKSGLPSKITKALQLRDKMTNNLLAAVPKALTLLNNVTTRRAFARKVNANAVEEQGLNGVIDFVNSFIETLQDTDKGIALETLSNPDDTNSPFRRSSLGKDGRAVSVTLHEYALQYFFDPETGKIDENLAAIMAIEAGQWLATGGASTLNNRNDTINDLIGRPRGTDLGEMDRPVFGNGTLMSNVVSKIGQRILSQAGLSLRGKDVDPLFLDELHSSIGTMALATMQQMDLVKIVPVTAAARDMLSGGLDAQGASNENFNLVHITPAGQYGQARFEESGANKDIRLAYTGAKRILADYFSASSYVQGPVLEAPKSPSMVSRALTKIPMAQKGNMANNSKYAWRPIKGAIALLDQFADADFERFILETEDAENTQVNLREGVESKAAGNARSLRQIREWVSENGTNPFFFAYRMIRSGRIYIDSSSINPQSDKLHRFVFAMDDWKVTMKTTNPNPTGKTYENFLLAVGLGLDVDSSKLTRKQALKKTKELLADETMQKVIELLQSGEKFDDKQAELIASVLPAGEKAHGLMAIKAYADYTAALSVPGRDSITIALPMETDGKTNGFASSALQTPPIEPGQMKQVMEMLRATGVYFDEDEFANYPEFAQTKGSLDNYQQVAQETAEIAQAMRNGRQVELTEPGNPKWEYYLSTIRQNRGSVNLINAAKFIVPDRNFAKTPLMVVSYGAGYASIRRAIVAKALVGFYEDMGRAETVKDVAEVLTRLQKVVDGTNKVTDRDYKAFMAEKVEELSKEENIREYALEYELDEEMKKDFETGLDAVYGHSLQKALENKLGPMSKVRKRLNEATYLANLIYVKNFERQVAQQERILGRKLANRERELIVRKMIKQGMVPVVKAPNSTGLNDALETTSSSTEIIGGDRKGRASFRRPLNVRNVGWTVKDGQIVRGTPRATKSMVGSLLGYKPDMNVGVAALVKMIHSSDGAVNGHVMGRNAILNVHDAQVGNFNKIDDIANQANKTFYETHRDWNLAQETFESLERLMPMLDEGDPRLSAQDKAEINSAFMAHLKEYATESKQLEKLEDTAEEALELRNKWFRSLQKMVDHTNQARVTLFSKIKSVNQFAKEGHKTSPVEYTVEKTDRGVINPNSASVVTAANNIDELMTVIRDQTTNAWAKKKREMVDKLVGLKERGGNVQQALNDWMEQSGLGHAPAAEDMLDVLYEVFEDDFTNTEHLQRFRDMISLLRPMLRIKDPETGKMRSVYVRLGSSQTMGTDEGQFRADGNIYINAKAKDPVTAILHEIVHAANVKQLTVLQQNGSPVFDELLKEATQWLKGARRAKEGSPTWAVYESIKAAALNDKEGRDLRIVTEYIAYLGTTMKVNSEGGRSFVFNSQKFDAMNAMARSLESKSGTNIFYSSSEKITQSLFVNQEGTKLTSETLEEVFESIKAMEKTPVGSALQEHFNKILNRFIVPGIASIDEVIVKMATNPNGKRNLGKWLNDPRESAIFLEATAQNYYTSAVDMSLQEVALHEILHAIFETALADPAISKEVERLIEKVQTQLTDNYGEGNEWQAFLPMDLALANDIDKKQAKDRYEHIFMNGTKSLQEFMAIGLTNPHFMEILTNVQDRAPEKIFEGGLVNTLFNILERAIQFVRESVMGRDGLTAGSSLERLAERIIYLNAKNQIVAKNGEDGGWLTQKLASLNDAALVQIANIVNSKLQAWAEKNSMSGQDVKEAAKDKNKAAALLLAARTATASSLDQNAMKGFREAFESAITGIEKDHWLYQMLTEVLPWADRNRGWIDALRNSEKMIDMVRQQKFEHTRTALMSYFDPKLKMSRTFREHVTRALLDTDIVALMEGPNAMKAGDLINLLKDPQATNDMIEALVQDLEKNLTQEQFNLFDFQSKGLASYMVTGRVGPVHVMNVDLIVGQDVLAKNDRTKVKNAAEVRDTLDRLTSLRSWSEVNPAIRQSVISVMEQEMSRPVKLNGFTGLMGTATTFKKLSFEKLFDRNPTFMEKGYTSDITDPEIELKAVNDTFEDREAMRQQGYTFVKTLSRADIDDGLNMVLYKKKLGVARFSKAVMSLTGEQKHGTGMFDSAFAGVPQGVPSNLIAAQVHNKIAAMRVDTQKMAKRIANGRPIAFTNQVQVAPLFNEDREMMDFRYVMDKDMKREHLKKRDMFDEVLPRMMSSIEDRTNTKTVNRGAIDLLFDEYVAARKSDNKDDYRFVAVGKDVLSEQGRELWNLLPEDTKRYATSKFGGEVIYLRDDVVNLVLGFRKVAWSNNKFLAPAAPVVDVAEKIWLEVMQWVRYRIAVLTPAVVIGNMVSNFALLLAQGVPPSYIYRQSKMAIIGMRKYQKDLRQMNELSLTVEALKTQGKFSAREEQKLIRLKHAIATNPVSVLVEEGMFTSIVEEFGIDEDSNRRQLTTKFLDKFGGITGAEGLVKVAQEAWMVPGSETGQMALMATQYGDFVGRFIQYNWNMRGVDIKTPEGKAKQRQVIHDALDTFIYYNVPQNRYLQFLNDNGFMMFTKFFFRIQHINARIFKKNPIQAAVVLGAQQGISTAVGGNRTAEENIANYAFLNNMTNKFQTPWDHIWGGDILTPTFLKWIPDTFFGS